MKKVLSFAAVLVAISALPAMAGDAPNYTFSIRGGGAFPLSNAYKEVYKGGVAGAMTFSGGLSSSLDWRLDAGYHKFNTDKTFDEVCALLGVDCQADLDGYNVTGGLEWHGDRSGDASLVPYVFAGAGIYHNAAAVFAGDTSGSFHDAAKATNFGVGGGAGFDWKAGESWGIRIDGRVDWAIRGSEKGDIWSFTPTGGVYFRF